MILTWFACCIIIHSVVIHSFNNPSNYLSPRFKRHHYLGDSLVVMKSRVYPEDDVKISSTSGALRSCNHCGKSFETRNSLFRHLRNDPLCSNLGNSNGSSMGKNSNVMKRDTMVVLCSYDVYQSKEGNYTGIIGYPSDAETVGTMICDAFNYALDKQFVDDEAASKVIGCTQTSVAKLRVASLGLENGISATGDVLTVTYEYPIKSTLLDEKKNFQETQRKKVFEAIKDNAIDFLSMPEMSLRKSLSLSIISNVCILSAKLLPEGKKLHAESYCTQRVLHYLLPIKWIKGGENIEKWWLQNKNHDEINTRYKETKTTFGIESEQRLVARPPEELRALKSILRRFESHQKNIDTGHFEVSKQRFGNLATKPLRPWHNFADPAIRGATVSPNNKPIWRALDRCRIVKLLSLSDLDALDDNSNCDDVIVVIEFRGDDFVQQQVRRIVGAVVAMTHGWLPQNFAEIATRPDVLLETPLAPNNRLYQARPRFHFDELSKKGRSIFYDEINEYDEAKLTEALHQRILQRCIGQTESEKRWLVRLSNDIGPRIFDQFKKYEDQNQIHSMSTSPCPPEYRKTLSLLKKIIETGQWPSTSIARSKVIKDKRQNRINDRDIYQNGSFTIINPNYLSGVLLDNNVGIKVPLGNSLFPDLVAAIFELEKYLSNEVSNKRRPPSSHCAVNCNAQFTPHVDSGRGCGQSLSMIVGLGSYTGGDLFIEEEAFDICYSPLEFDGWRNRHWTQPFKGERFSLVWFTPAMTGINDG